MKKESLYHHRSQLGNGVLEMLLSIPIALILLFVAVDLGLSYLDRAMISDAARETAHEYAPSQFSENTSPMFTVSGQGIVLNEQSMLDYTTRIANRFKTIVEERRVVLGSQNSLQNVKIIVTPVLLSINTQSGAILGHDKVLAAEASVGNLGLTLSSKNHQISSDQYLVNLFSSAFQGTYAVPTISMSAGGDRYLPQSLGVLVSVEAISPQINPYIGELVLGGNMGIQIHEFQLVRN